MHVYSAYSADPETSRAYKAFVKDDSELHPNREIDSFQWFSPEDARKNIRQGSLAADFLNAYLDEAGQKR